MPDNDKILAQLRAIVDEAGTGIQNPVASHGPTSWIQPMTQRRRLMSGSPVPEPEPLAEKDIFGLINRSPIGLLTDVTNPLEAAAPGGFLKGPKRLGGKALPMDTASRMQRADDLGFTQDVYHGTYKDFPEFNSPIRYGGYGTGDFGIHVSADPQAANVRHSPMAAFENTEVTSTDRGGRVMPLRAMMNKTVTMPDMGIWKDPNNFIRKIETMRDESNDPALMDKLYEAASEIQRTQGMKYPDQTNIWQHRFREALQDAGYDSVKYANYTESDGAPSYLLLDPRQLRSRFAKFDPANANSRDLLASLAAALGLSGLASSHKSEKP